MRDGIAILLVNWNGREDLKACLGALGRQTRPADEIVVVDNGSTDGSVEMLAREFPRVKVLATGENLGFAEGCNRGLPLTTQPWVLTLNNDTEAEPDMLEALYAAARIAPARVGMLQAHLRFMDRPHLTNSTGVVMFSNGCFQDRGFEAPADTDGGPAEIFCVSAGAGLYRREMLEQVRLPSGVFDKTFFMYLEDVDLGWRCRIAGWEARYVPEAVVYHRFQASSSRQKRSFAKVHSSNNRVRTLLKNASFGALWRLSPHVVAESVVLVHEEGLAAIPGLWRAFVDGLEQRADVSALVVEPRDAIEQRWIRPAERRWLNRLLGRHSSPRKPD
jgi:GT2 family glycosyltransferase